MSTVSLWECDRCKARTPAGKSRKDAGWSYVGADADTGRPGGDICEACTKAFGLWWEKGQDRKARK